ncbi:MAG: cell division protein FtsK [Flavobacteriales bacterium]|nr:cell division protein FtsK [Flavobacteriales bacterium]
MSDIYYKIKTSISLIGKATSVFLFLSFNSFWKYGKVDQSEVIGQNNNYVNTQNLLGGIGAETSEFFISLFGISAYLIVSITFILSFKLLFNIKKIKYLNLIIHHIFLIIWIPLMLSKYSQGIICGKTGIYSSSILIPLIGNIGITLLLILTLFLYIVIGFNVTSNKIKKLKEYFLYVLNQTINKIKEKRNLKYNLKSNTIRDSKPGILEIKPNDTDLNQNFTTTKVKTNEKSQIVVEIAQKEKVSDQNNLKLKDATEKYIYPSLDLLKNYEKNDISIDKNEVEKNKKLIEDTLKDFKIDVTVKRATVGPTITLYEIVPDEGVRISKIKNLENDIALRIKAIGVRIIAPLPGKGTVGIEVPNQKPTIVSMKNVLESEKFQNSNFELPIALGKTISNETFILDLTKMPHLLIAGATGQGKSVGLNAVLCSILYKKHPSEIKFILVDPKKVELTLYNRIKKHFLAQLPNDNDAIITDTKKVVKTLKSLCLEMDNRYEMLKKAEVRNIQEYNDKIKSNSSNNNEHKFLPYLVLVIDEFADLIMTAGKEVEIPIARLAQLARAIGIHLIIATQRPTTNIITGTIKANFPTRIAFRVIQGIDSKTIIDTVGANQLIGRGDMLISTGSSLSRIQCAFIDTSEVDKLTTFIGNQLSDTKPFELPVEAENVEVNVKNIEERDPLFKEAALLIVMHQQGSTSMIQRKLKLGYNRAGRIVDQLESAGILGPLEGSKGRKVLVQTEDELNQII